MSLNVNQRLMATAGHCSANWSGAITGWQFQSTDRSGTLNLGLFGWSAINALGNPDSAHADVALLGANQVAYDRMVWLNEDWQSAMVTSKDSVLSGQVGQVCTSGASTDAQPGVGNAIRCSMNVSFSQTTAYLHVDYQYYYREQVYTALSCSPLAIPGDSGAAMWQWTGTGTIEVNGMVIGGNSDDVPSEVCSSQKLYRTVFLQVGEIEALTGAYVETSAGSGVSW